MKKRLQWWSGVAALVGTALFVLLTLDVVFHGIAEQQDLPIARFINDNRSYFLIEICSCLSHLGDTPITASVVILASLGLLVARRQALLGYYLLAVLGEVIVVKGVKLLIARPRPTLYAFYQPQAGFSYPSGHTMGAVVVYGMLAYVLYRLSEKESAGWIFATLAALLSFSVGCAVVYIGVHYITDMLGGLTAGAAVLGACVFLGQRQYAGGTTKKKPRRRSTPSASRRR